MTMTVHRLSLESTTRDVLLVSSSEIYSHPLVDRSQYGVITFNFSNAVVRFRRNNLDDATHRGGAFLKFFCVEVSTRIGLNVVGCSRVNVDLAHTHGSVRRVLASFNAFVNFPPTVDMVDDPVSISSRLRRGVAKCKPGEAPLFLFLCACL